MISGFGCLEIMPNDEDWPFYQVYPVSGPSTWVVSENFTRCPAQADLCITGSNPHSIVPYNVEQYMYNCIEARPFSSQVGSAEKSLCGCTGSMFQEVDGHARIMPTNLSIAASFYRANPSDVQSSSRMITEEQSQQNKRKRNEEDTSYVPFQPNEPNPHFARPIKRNRLSSPSSSNYISEGITFSWVNGRLSTEQCEELRRILTRFRSKGTRFREYLYCDVLWNLDPKTCAHIVSLWKGVAGPLLPTMSSSGLNSMESEGDDTYRALYWILQGSQVAKLPFLKLRKVLWSSDIKVQDILEVEKLLLLREMEELGTQYLNLESETPFNDL